MKPENPPAPERWGVYCSAVPNGQPISVHRTEADALKYARAMKRECATKGATHPVRKIES
jgi:hypothetical protein